MSKTNPVCGDCGVELTDDNWYPSYQKTNHYICKSCQNKQMRQWRKTNSDKVKAMWARVRRKKGQLSMNANKECPSFLGVYIAERVLSQAFNNVKQMPYGNTGFDFICGQGYKIDVKSSCLNKNGRWYFHIAHNTIADYFLCLAFDNREDLNPLYIWPIPGEKINHLTGTSICPSTIHKWDEYKLPIDRVVSCCNMMKGEQDI